MAGALLDPVEVLLQRGEFLEGIKEIALLCNWSIEDTEALCELVWDELVAIDNLMYAIYESSQDRTQALYTWERKTEELRRWLSLMLGVKLRYL